MRKNNLARLEVGRTDDLQPTRAKDARQLSQLQRRANQESRAGCRSEVKFNHENRSKYVIEKAGK